MGNHKVKRIVVKLPRGVTAQELRDARALAARSGIVEGSGLLLRVCIAAARAGRGTPAEVRAAWQRMAAAARRAWQVRRNPPRRRARSAFDDVVDYRLRESAELLAGHGGRTGRVKRDDQGEAIGRMPGYGNAAPEIRGLASPRRMSDAIERRRGKLFERIKWETQRWVAKNFPEYQPKQRGIVAGPHAGNRKCKTCGHAHSATDHRSHGPGAFRGRARHVRELGEEYGELRAPEALPDWVLENPRPKMIYGEVLRIVARRSNPHKCSARCRRANHIYAHTFRRREGIPAIYGVNGGRGAIIR